MPDGVSSKINLATRAAALVYPYGWTVTGPAGNELAFKHCNGTSVQMVVTSDADFLAKANYHENLRGDKNLTSN